MGNAQINSSKFKEMFDEESKGTSSLSVEECEKLFLKIASMLKSDQQLERGELEEVSEEGKVSKREFERLMLSKLEEKNLSL